MANGKMGLKNVQLRPIGQKVFQTKTRLRRCGKNTPKNIFSPAAKNVARPRSRVALRAASLAAAAAQNGFFTQMLRARNSATAN